MLIFFAGHFYTHAHRRFTGKLCDILERKGMYEYKFVVRIKMMNEWIVFAYILRKKIDRKVLEMKDGVNAIDCRALLKRV